ncbi:probable polygalacturonase [Euphorbia lathyris]|uniref:probable polygalacturonase n=1 Tax=Euphorbia lathyris TaxID=212925 RepID=UPI003313BE9C
MQYSALNCRKHSALLTDFGGVGDGKTMNTKAFTTAMQKMSQFGKDGGAELIVPSGKWLTGAFNITISHFTLFLEKDAIILASKNEADWPVIAPLPSYGKGRESDGSRFNSLISGTNLTDVVITGNNGTIDGQGKSWWDKFKQKKLKHTRPYLIEIMHTNQLQISNITVTNSPSWHIHPIYCKNVIIQWVTVLAPVLVPNTDGINPDSCTNIRIEDCFLQSGDDCIAVKSGWDQYGIKYGMPTKDLVVRRVTCISPDSATVALGSEMSGGIENIRIEDVTALNTQSAIRMKTAIGRGGYVRDIFVRKLRLYNQYYGFWMTSSYSQHPDNGWDRNALPNISRIYHDDIIATNVTIPARIEGMKNNPFTDICISNVNMKLTAKPKKLLWNCTDVIGVASNVTPKPCSAFTEKPNFKCQFPTDKLAIETVQLKTCSTSGTP